MVVFFYPFRWGQFLWAITEHLWSKIVLFATDHFLLAILVGGDFLFCVLLFYLKINTVCLIGLPVFTLYINQIVSPLCLKPSRIPYDPAYVPKMENRHSSRYSYTNIHSIIHNNQKVERTPVSISKWMDKQNVIHTYSGKLIIHEKKWMFDTYHYMNEWTLKTLC